MKIYLYISDGQDGSYSIMYFKSEEDRAKQEEYDELMCGRTAEGCCDYEIDTDDVEFDDPPSDEDWEDIKEEEDE